MGLESRRLIVEAMRAAMLREAENAWRTWPTPRPASVVPTDKVKKNLMVTTRTPGTEDLEPQAVTGDEGMTVTEYAPYGVIGSITPTTNPTSTIINNSIAMVAAGNAVTFNVHPGAKKVSVENIKLLNHAIVGAGGPTRSRHRNSQPDSRVGQGADASSRCAGTAGHRRTGGRR